MEKIYAKKLIKMIRKKHMWAAGQNTAGQKTSKCLKILEGILVSITKSTDKDYKNTRIIIHG